MAAQRGMANPRTLELARRAELADGMMSPVPIELRAPLRLCRIVDRAKSYDAAISPWWISEADLAKIIDARGASRAAHGGDKARGLSAGLLARSALGIPHVWPGGPRTTMDLLLMGDVKPGVVRAYAGKGRQKRETAPNGIELIWSPWSSITQIYIPALSRHNDPEPTLATVETLMTLGAEKFFVSRQLY